MISHWPHFSLDVSSLCCVYFLSQTIVRLSPGVWLLTQTTEPETKTVGAGVISLLPAGAGEHNFRIKDGQRKGCWETKKIRARMILLPPRPLIEADLMRVRDDNKETFAPILKVFVSKVLLRSRAPRVAQPAQRSLGLRFKDNFFIICLFILNVVHVLCFVPRRQCVITFQTKSNLNII